MIGSYCLPGAFTRSRCTAVSEQKLQRSLTAAKEDGGKDGELRSGLSPGGRVRLSPHVSMTLREWCPLGFSGFLFCAHALHNTVRAVDEALKWLCDNTGSGVLCRRLRAGVFVPFKTKDDQIDYCFLVISERRDQADGVQGGEELEELPSVYLCVSARHAAVLWHCDDSRCVIMLQSWTVEQLDQKVGYPKSL